MIEIDGASRMSSVLGLKVRPQNGDGFAIDFVFAHLRDFARHGAFAVFVDRYDHLDQAQGAAHDLGAVRTSASVSFGKQEPP